MNHWLEVMTDALLHMNFWGWMVAAALLIAIELLSFNTLTLWVGIAASIVAIVKLFVTIPFGWDWILFAFLSLMMLFFIRKLFAHKAHNTDTADFLNQRGLAYVGQTFCLEESVHNNKGRILIEGVWWILSGPDCPAGTSIHIVALENTTLKFRV